ncbi:MAG: complex I NDUFA9 subunit family protein [Pseudomonadota bacterium]|nr:complex I NDUFA9 subunit family protein [Pseudomonadota bacterium]
MENEIVTVFGGSGFIGRHVISRLARKGSIVRVAVRDVESAKFLRTMGQVGQVVPIAADIGDEKHIASAVKGADSVINLVGILHQSGGQNFQRIHVKGASSIASVVASEEVKNFVQVSAIGANSNSESVYARTKAAAEQSVMEHFAHTTIIRPSVIFGPEDNFFNMFARISRISPILPVLGCPTIPKMKFFKGGFPMAINFFGNGGTRFQPVYVGDVADVVMMAITDPKLRGQTYELGGPKVYNFKELMELMLTIMGRKKLLVPMPFWYLHIFGFLLGLLPNPMLTTDQVKLLYYDNVVSNKAQGLDDLGISPTPLEIVLPNYLDRFKSRSNKVYPGSTI